MGFLQAGLSRVRVGVTSPCKLWYESWELVTGLYPSVTALSYDYRFWRSTACDGQTDRQDRQTSISEREKNVRAFDMCMTNWRLQSPTSRDDIDQRQRIRIQIFKLRSSSKSGINTYHERENVCCSFVSSSNVCLYFWTFVIKTSSMHPTRNNFKSS